MGFREPHFDWVLRDETSPSQGQIPIYTWKNFRRDPRSLLIKCARYKFVAKILRGRDRVVEIGCGDGFAAPLVAQEVTNLTVTDIDPRFLELAKAFVEPWENISAKAHEQVFFPQAREQFDGLYALDVLEHIPEAEEDEFLSRTANALRENGIAVFGVPSPESQQFTTEDNRKGHVNVKSVEGFTSLLSQHFESVIDFGMNDEVVHTGFIPMRSYNFFVCNGPKVS